MNMEYKDSGAVNVTVSELYLLIVRVQELKTFLRAYPMKQHAAHG